MPNYVYCCASYHLVGEEPNEHISLDESDRQMNAQQTRYVTAACAYPPGLVRMLDVDKLRSALKMYEILKSYVKVMTGKVSFLLDYDHSRCVLQIENLCGLNFYEATERETFAALLTRSDGVNFSLQARDGFCLTLRMDLFYMDPNTLGRQ